MAKRPRARFDEVGALSLLLESLSRGRDGDRMASLSMRKGGGGGYGKNEAHGYYRGVGDKHSFNPYMRRLKPRRKPRYPGRSNNSKVNGTNWGISRY